MTVQDNDSWMLELITPVPGVRFAVVCSADGLPTVWTDTIDRDEADWAAATSAGLSSLGRQASQRYGEGEDARQVMVEYAGGFLFVRGAGDGSRLIVVAEAKIDPKLLGQQMAAQVQQIGAPTLSTPARNG